MNNFYIFQTNKSLMLLEYEMLLNIFEVFIKIILVNIFISVKHKEFLFDAIKNIKQK